MKSVMARNIAFPMSCANTNFADVQALAHTCTSTTQKLLPWPPVSGELAESKKGQGEMEARNAMPGGKQQVAWKTIPCWHFVKRQGECPHGASCAFVHDINLHKVLERDREHEKKATGIGKNSHCWAYVQGRCHRSKCSYLHPVDIKPYIPYTPCVHWSYCERTPYCRFQHPAWVYAHGVMKEQGKVVQSIYFEALATICGRPVECGGTTYFPLFKPGVVENGCRAAGGNGGLDNKNHRFNVGEKQDIIAQRVTVAAIAG